VLPITGRLYPYVFIRFFEDTMIGEKNT
jgi:hypothetical protein